MPDPMNIRDWSEEDLLTGCLWAEARGESEDGVRAIGCVIMNRVRKGMTKTIKSAILAPRQFSWTMQRDPNFVATTEEYRRALRGSPSATWKRAQDIARDVITGKQPDITNGADHYLNIPLTKRIRGGILPGWAQEAIEKGKLTKTIGNHSFLNLLG